MLTTLLEMSPMSFASLLQVAPQREVLKACNQMLPQLFGPEATEILKCYCGHLFCTWPELAKIYCGIETYFNDHPQC